MWQAAVSKSVYVVNYIIKGPHSFTDSSFNFTLVFILTLGAFRRSFQPNLGNGSKWFRNSGLEIIHIRGIGVMEFIISK